MPGFFEAFENLGTVPEKKFTVTIDGKEAEVDLSTKKNIILKGEQAYTWKDGTIVEKPTTKKTNLSYKTLKRSKYGYEFHNHDPHWPKHLVEGGFSWQIESE